MHVGLPDDDSWPESAEVGIAPLRGLRAIREEASRRDIPWVPWPIYGAGQLGYGVHQRRLWGRLWGARTDRTSAIGDLMAGSKEFSKAHLHEHGVPVPRGVTIGSPHELPYALSVSGLPAVVKPARGAKGLGVSVDVRSRFGALRAFFTAFLVSRRVVVERFHPGNDYRLLMLGGRLLAAAHRTPAKVIGDGRSTIRELIDRFNADPRRDPRVGLRSRVSVTRASRRLLRRQGYRLGDVLPASQVAFLKGTANLSTGGSSRDATEMVHPDTVWMAERVAALVGLDILGIDIVSPDITRPLAENGGAVLEVNSNPGVSMHLAPDEGTPRNVTAAIVDTLFPPGSLSRIPIVAVAQADGGTTTTCLVAHLLRAKGLSVGWCTSRGTFVDGRRLLARDAANPKGARCVLRDPTVEAAVLEVAGDGLLGGDLGFDGCDVGILTNIQSDHFELAGIAAPEDRARVKGAVIEAVRPSGLAVLNADDPLAADQSDRTKSRIGYFTLDPQNPVVRRHTEAGGLAAVCDGDSVDLLEDASVRRLGPVRDLPIASDGRAPFTVARVLAACLAVYALGMEPDRIWSELQRFQPARERLPGG